MNPVVTNKSIVVLVSGNGSNLQTIIDAVTSGRIPAPAKISAVISNIPNVVALERAAKVGIPTKVVDHKDFDSREAFDQRLQAVIDQYAPDLVVLSGFMRLLTESFVMHYQGRMINIHPSLLPKYRGLNTHKKALEAGDARHGASVHFVTPDLDSGPVVIQAYVSIVKDDTVESLAERVLKEEHIIYPLVISWFVAGALYMQEGDIIYNGDVLSAPIIWSGSYG